MVQEVTLIKAHMLKNIVKKKFNLPVNFTKRKEESSFGAIINASVAMNTFSDYSNAIEEINRET